MKPAPVTETVFVIDIAETPTVAFQAFSHKEAQGLLKEPWFRTDLQGLRSSGVPLWDGKTKLGVRRASAEECERFAESKTAAFDGSDDLVLFYLVDLDGHR